MDLLAAVLVAIVGLLHLWFLVLEMVLWQRPLGLRTFRLTPEQYGRAVDKLIEGG